MVQTQICIKSIYFLYAWSGLQFMHLGEISWRLHSLSSNPDCHLNRCLFLRFVKWPESDQYLCTYAWCCIELDCITRQCILYNTISNISSTNKIWHALLGTHCQILSQWFSGCLTPQQSGIGYLGNAIPALQNKVPQKPSMSQRSKKCHPLDSIKVTKTML